MPQIFKIGSYWVFFWSNENKPLEPVHVHVAKGAPRANAAKIWITKSGKCLPVGNDHPDIEDRTFHNIVRIIEARSGEIIQAWLDYFGETKFIC